MPSAHLATQLLTTYGYLGLFAAAFVAAVGIGAPIPVTALLLTVGALSATRGGPSFAALSIAGSAGAIGGHLVDYSVGRLGNRLVQRWLARLQQRLGANAALDHVMRLRGGRALLLFVSRFLLTPIASPVSVLSGVTRMGFATYVTLEVSGTAIYVLGNLSLGRYFGTGLFTQGGALPIFWIVVTIATLAPVVLIRVAPSLLNRTHFGAASPASKEPSPSPVEGAPAAPGGR